MEIKDKTFDKRLDDNQVSPEELTEYLVRNYSVYELANELAGYVIEDRQYENNMIILSPVQDQLLERLFNKLIRLKHLDKGRKAKTEKYLRQRETLDDGLFKD